ncbi:MAG: hypothetical protein QXH96_01140 [Candidatus Geothermarchaeota archaeon]
MKGINKGYSIEDERLLKLLNWFTHINRDESLVIIVEGKTDKEMLSKFVKLNSIFSLNERGILRKIHSYAEKKYRFLILTDFDKEGEALNEKITTLLRALNAEVLENERRNFRYYSEKLGDTVYEVIKHISEIYNRYYQLF